MLKQAGPQVKFMHCLPAERGVECDDGAMESRESSLALLHMHAVDSACMPLKKVLSIVG